MVVLLVKIPTLSEWDGYDLVGLNSRSWSRVSPNEYNQIKIALKRKTIKEVALKFNRNYTTIWKIAKETK